MSDETFNISWVSLYSSREFETEDELVSRYRSLEDLSAPQGFKNRIIDINRENPVDSEIHIGASGSEPPTELDQDVVAIKSYEYPEDEENQEDSEENQTDQSEAIGEQWIRATFNSENIDELQSLFSEIVAKVEPLTAKSLTIVLTAPIGLRELDTPLDWSTEKEISGVKFRQDDVDTLIQKAPNSDEVMIRYSDESAKELTSDEAHDFLENRLQKARDRLEELKE